MWENCLVVWGKSRPLHSPPTPAPPIRARSRIFGSVGLGFQVPVEL